MHAENIGQHSQTENSLRGLIDSAAPRSVNSRSLRRTPCRGLGHSGRAGSCYCTLVRHLDAYCAHRTNRRWTVASQPQVTPT
jgi:hypothetical protein